MPLLLKWVFAVLIVILVGFDVTEAVFDEKDPKLNLCNNFDKLANSCVDLLVSFMFVYIGCKIQEATRTQVKERNSYTSRNRYLSGELT